MTYKKIYESKYGGTEDNYNVTRNGNRLDVELTYPPYTDEANHGQVRYILIDQESVRASDGIRLHYDYVRDGWAICQASTFQWEVDDEVCDPDWQEVAFIQSWAREKEGEEL